MAKLQILVRLQDFANLAVMPNTIAKFDILDTGSARCLDISWLPAERGELIIVQRDVHGNKMFAVTLPCNGTHAPHNYILPKLQEVTHIEVLSNCVVTILGLSLATWDTTVADAMTYAGLQVRGSELFTVAPSPEGNVAFLECGRYPSVDVSIPRVLGRGSFYSFLLRARGIVTLLLPGAVRATLQGTVLGKWPTSNFATSIARGDAVPVSFELMLAENAVHADTCSGVAYASQRRVIDI